MNMKKMFAFLLAMTLTLACAPAFAQEGAASVTPVPQEMTESMLARMQSAQITVQGTAQVSADPDIVSVTTNAEVTALTISDAQSQMSEIIGNVTAKLLELGVADKDIVTTNYSYYPIFNYDADTPQLTGYRASHTLEIICRDTGMLDGVIGVATDNGMSEIYGVNYDVSNRSELYKQALELAIEAAEQKAARMAQTTGRTLTGLVSLTENGGYDVGYSVNATADMARLSVSAAATGIRSGTVSVSASVTAVYEAGE